MATSKHLGLRDAVAALFAAAPALANGNIQENRDQPLDERSASQISVYRVQSIPERELLGSLAPIDWTTDIRVVIKARSMDGTSAEAAADDIACSVYSRLMADQGLGGLCNLMDPGPFQWDQDEADVHVVVVVFDVRLQHRTEANTVAA